MLKKNQAHTLWVYMKQAKKESIYQNWNLIDACKNVNNKTYFFKNK